MKNFVSEQEAALQNQVIPQTKKADFKEFWLNAVEKMREVPLEITRKKLDLPYEKSFVTYEIIYNTHDDTKIHAYFSCPVGAKNLPCVVYYHGGHQQKEIQYDIVATGVCCFAMDVRGQGGDSIDQAVYTSGGVNGGLMTCGILEKENFYMLNIYLDAVRAMDVVASLSEVNPQKIVTFGGSQGGALSIVASALSGRSQKCYTAVTSYCCLKERTLFGSMIFGSVHNYLHKHPEETDHVFDVLSYFDIINMVSLLKVPTSFALGLTDDVCLPHFVYSAYAHTQCEKQLNIYPFVPHEIPHLFKQMAFWEFVNM